MFQAYNSDVEPLKMIGRGGSTGPKTGATLASHPHPSNRYVHSHNLYMLFPLYGEDGNSKVGFFEFLYAPTLFFGVWLVIHAAINIWGIYSEWFTRNNLKTIFWFHFTANHDRNMFTKLMGKYDPHGNKLKQTGRFLGYQVLACAPNVACQIAVAILYQLPYHGLVAWLQWMTVVGCGGWACYLGGRGFEQSSKEVRGELETMGNKLLSDGTTVI